MQPHASPRFSETREISIHQGRDPFELTQVDGFNTVDDSDYI